MDPAQAACACVARSLAFSVSSSRSLQLTKAAIWWFGGVLGVTAGTLVPIGALCIVEVKHTATFVLWLLTAFGKEASWK